MEENKNSAVESKPDELEYWKKRCLAAEDYIEKSPCDPDIYADQLEAYNKWEEIKSPLSGTTPASEANNTFNSEK